MAFKLNRTGRRFLRTLGTLFGLWIIFSIYYMSTWTKTPDRTQEPVTIVMSDPAFHSQIDKAQTYLKEVTTHLDVPSFSVAVGYKDQLIWSAAAGYKDVALEKPATPLTQYRIGSTSKAVTASGIARLVNAEKLDLDALVGDTIINWPQKKWNFSTRQLLSHTAGVGNYEDFGVASGKYTLCNCHQFNSVTEGLNVFNRYKLLYEPGTAFQYSTFDINLASAVLEQAAQEQFLDYMDRQVFEPLEMTSTYADHAKPKTEHFATFYQTDDGYYREYRNFEIKYDVNMSYKWAGGGFISTPTDLVKLGNAWLNDPAFLSSETKQEFWTPIKLNTGEVNWQEYALGWRSHLSYESEDFLNNEPVWMVHHGGVSKGSMNFLVIFPNYNLVIDASINARAEEFHYFSKEVRVLANYFLETIKKEPVDSHQDILNQINQ